MFFLQEGVPNNGQGQEDMPCSGKVVNIACADDIQVISSEQIVTCDSIRDDAVDTKDTYL